LIFLLKVKQTVIAKDVKQFLPLQGLKILSPYEKTSHADSFPAMTPAGFFSRLAARLSPQSIFLYFAAVVSGQGKAVCGEPVEP
jgi:hypothetical protein